MNKNTLRTIDANFNRSREGLRVCEEIARFILNDKIFTRRLKRIRHDIEGTVNSVSQLKRKLVEARGVEYDVGKESSLSELHRRNAKDIFDANLERSKEAIRVMEEFFKLINKTKSGEFKKLRFRLYNLERKSVEKLDSLRNIR